jgi:hypothetical protein
MNYKPFSAIARGDIFNMVERPDVPMMKCGDNTAVYLEGVWIDGRLYSRGQDIRVDEATCIICPEVAELTIPVAKVDPIDPRSKFWREGDQVTCGSGSRAQVNVFAGLFLYSGFGAGTYYSGVDNEMFFISTEAAEKRAKAEEIPFVYFDRFSWTFDPTLSHERMQAQEKLDR